MQTLYSMSICVISFCHAVARREKNWPSAPLLWHQNDASMINMMIMIMILIVWKFPYIPLKLVVMCAYLCKLNLGESAVWTFRNYPLLTNRKTTIESHHNMSSILYLWSAWAHKFAWFYTNRVFPNFTTITKQIANQLTNNYNRIYLFISIKIFPHAAGWLNKLP